MNLLTLGAAKEPIARAIGLCTTDSLLVSLINEAQERILNKSIKPVGSYGRFRFCVTDGCIVLPRQIRTVESWSLCDWPGMVVPEWHEFLGNGTHLYDNDDTIGRVMIDRGTVSTFNDVDPGKSVTAVTIGASSADWTTATVTFTNDPDDTTGSGAAGTVNIVGGAISSVTITDSGSGYTAAPSVTFSGDGTSASATATIARNRKIRVVSSVAESASSRILLLGHDDNGQWVRTLDSGSWIDGEYVTISNTPTYSTNIFSSLERDVKPITNGVVRLHTWDSTANIIQRSLAAYEPSEERPVYRKMFVPNLINLGGCQTSSSCSSRSISVLAKLQHVPVSSDNDFLVIGNLAALKLMATAIFREEQNRFDEAEILERKAVRELEGERSSYDGDGQFVSVKALDSETWSGSVWNPI